MKIGGNQMSAGTHTPYQSLVNQINLSSMTKTEKEIILKSLNQLVESIERKYNQC